MVSTEPTRSFSASGAVTRRRNLRHFVSTIIFSQLDRGGIDDTSHDAFRGRVGLEGSEYSTFSSRAFEGQPVRPVAYGIECIIR